MGYLKPRSPKRLQSSEGLTYVEVMVGMLTSALFLSTTLQAYLAATSIRVKTQQMNTAIATIQADIEAIRQMAQLSPKAAADCQLPPSSSYAQQIMKAVIAKDTATINTSTSPVPRMDGVSPTGGASVLEQHTTLPLSGLPQDYTLQRILSVDLNEQPSLQVLNMSYQVLRTATQTQMDDNTDRPQPHRFEVKTPIVQRTLSILPNAALVCVL